MASNPAADILFFGIDNGNNCDFEILSQIKESNPNIKIIIVSDCLVKIQEVFFNIEPFGFIQKPVVPEMIFRYIEKAIDEKENSTQSLNFSFGKKSYKVKCGNIHYIESQRNKSIIHLGNKELHLMAKLDDVQPQLPDYFVRCHKSYLVNMNYADCYNSQYFEMSCNKIIPVSRSRKAETEKKFFYFKGIL